MKQNRDNVKKMFDLMMRVVVVYSFERLRIRQIYNDDCLWYEEKNLEIESAADRFLSSFPPNINTEKVYVDTENFGKKFRQELVRYFWNFHQYGIKPHNPEIFESLGYQQEQIHHWISNTHAGFFPEIRWRTANPRCFEDDYNIYSFLVPDQFEQIFFKYYKILKLLEASSDANAPAKAEEGFLAALNNLIHLIPYYSPYSMQAFTDLESYRGESFGKKIFTVCRLRRLVNVEMTQLDPVTQSVTYLSLEHQPIALIDTILQFLLKHLHHLVHWHFFSYEMIESDSQERIQQKILKGEDEDFKQLEQVASLLEAMFTALPKKQKTIYDFVEKKESTKTVMHSLMLFYFEDQFIKREQIKPIEVSDSENVAEPKLSRKDKGRLNKEFFEFLEAGFENSGIKTKSKMDGRFDTWTLKLAFSEEVEISGASIRSNAINHRKLLN